MNEQSAQKQLDAFMARYTPEIRSMAKAVLRKMRARLPGAIEMVYDNYNGLVIGFGPTERASDAIFSIVRYPRWVTLFFLNGASLPDPQKVLKGNGKTVRHLVLREPADLDQPAVQELMARALKRAKPIDDTKRGRIIIKSISEKQRARRPSAP